MVELKHIVLPSSPESVKEHKVSDGFKFEAEPQDGSGEPEVDGGIVTPFTLLQFDPHSATSGSTGSTVDALVCSLWPK